VEGADKGVAGKPSLAAYGPGERELLRAVRDLVRADRDMRRDAGVRMRLSPNELRAVRFVLDRGREDRPVTPGALAAHLQITTASTTGLLDHLVAVGHLERAPHPTDRRSKTLVATEHAREEAHAHLAGVHERMRAAAAAVPEEARGALLGFLRALAEAMDDA
jgi:DNA-binding MarR family transcriptional regulator